MTPTPFTPFNPAYYAVPAIAAANHATSVQDTSSIDPDVALSFIAGGWLVVIVLTFIVFWLSDRANHKRLQQNRNNAG